MISNLIISVMLYIAIGYIINNFIKQSTSVAYISKKVRKRRLYMNLFLWPILLTLAFILHNK